LLSIVIVMIVILVLAGVVLAYAAWPARGEEVPGAPWLGEALEKVADAAPLVEDDEDNEPVPHRLLG
jgi:hypothetical protein